jgi:NitT/TauT family transport system ATP-binding protein
MIPVRHPQVSLHQVEKTFTPPGGRGASFTALGPLDLELHHGEFFAVVGPSGCGKSTLLEIVAGLSVATRGEVAFEGRPIAGRIPQGVGVVFRTGSSGRWRRWG